MIQCRWTQRPKCPLMRAALWVPPNCAPSPRKRIGTHCWVAVLDCFVNSVHLISYVIETMARGTGECGLPIYTGRKESVFIGGGCFGSQRRRDVAGPTKQHWYGFDFHQIDDFRSTLLRPTLLGRTQLPLALDRVMEQHHPANGNWYVVCCRWWFDSCCHVCLRWPFWPNNFWLSLCPCTLSLISWLACISH